MNIANVDSLDFIEIHKNSRNYSESESRLNVGNRPDCSANGELLLDKLIELNDD